MHKLLCVLPRRSKFSVHLLLLHRWTTNWRGGGFSLIFCSMYIIEIMFVCTLSVGRLLGGTRFYSHFKNLKFCENIYQVNLKGISHGLFTVVCRKNKLSKSCCTISFGSDRMLHCWQNIYGLKVLPPAPQLASWKFIKIWWIELRWLPVVAAFTISCGINFRGLPLTKCTAYGG